MARFKIGQKVVALRTHSSSCFKKGDEFIIDGFGCCPRCGIPTLYLNKLIAAKEINHTECGYVGQVEREHYWDGLFAPLANISDAIEYRLTVSIPELTEIKETQLQ